MFYFTLFTEAHTCTHTLTHTHSHALQTELGLSRISCTVYLSNVENNGSVLHPVHLTVLTQGRKNQRRQVNHFPTVRTTCLFVCGPQRPEGRLGTQYMLVGESAPDSFPCSGRVQLFRLDFPWHKLNRRDLCRGDVTGFTNQSLCTKDVSCWPDRLCLLLSVLKHQAGH